MSDNTLVVSDAVLPSALKISAADGGSCLSGYFYTVSHFR